MDCTCTQYTPLTLDRKSISKRIKASKTIIKALNLLAEGGPLQLKLLQCPVCQQYWQTGREWNFGNGEYVFQVPAIEPAEWLAEPYSQPAAWLIYGAVTENYFSKNSFEQGPNPCRVVGCPELAIRLSGVCQAHHIAQLEQFGLLPKRPTGRLFAPYQ